MDWLPYCICIVLRATYSATPSGRPSLSPQRSTRSGAMITSLCHVATPSVLAHPHLPALTRPTHNPPSSLRASVLHALRPPTLGRVSVEDSLHRRRLRAVASVEDSLHHSQPSRPPLGSRAGAPIVLVPRPLFAP